jgi:hypothetical protein
MMSISKNDNNHTETNMKELNKEWRKYTRQIDNIISNENIQLQKNVTFIIRIKKGSGVSLCDILEAELKKMDKIIDMLIND